MMLVIRCLALLSTSGSYQITTTCAGIPHSSSGDLTCGSTFTGDTTGAAHVVGSSSGEHFYRLAVTAPREYTFSTCDGSSYDTWLRLYSGNHLESSSTEIASVDDACSSRSRIVMTLQPGAYTVVVEGYSSREGVCGVSMTLSFDVFLVDFSPTCTPASACNALLDLLIRA